MKKLLIMLMVVAMASFLFVGCLGGVVPDVDVDEEPAVAVTGVTLDEATLALTVGDAAVTLVATVAPATATDTSVIWASSDKTVAIVAAGVVTPLNAGISAITATTVDGGFVATCVVTVVAAGEPMITSTIPVIEHITGISLHSSKTQYINKKEVGAEDGILVEGSAPKYSEVQVYVDGAVVGTSISYGVLEGFIVFVAEDDLGVDGEKTLYATATEVGLEESDPSIEYAFTLDVVAPKIEKVAADFEEETITVTFDEAVDEDTAEENESYIVDNITYHFEVYTLDADLISAKVVELEVYPYNWWGDEGDTIRVTCEIIEDLAGNEATDLFGYCYLEGEEPEPYVYEPMELIYDDLEFTVGLETLFEVGLVANDDEGKIVKAWLTLPPGFPATVMEFLWTDEFGSHALPLEAGPNQIGEPDGSPLIDQTLHFKVLFPEVWIYLLEVKVETFPYDDDDILYEDLILVTVVGE